ncbi:hypothetical protein [Mucilaginibacter ginsenosidivorans]|uniref:Lipocalin-like domain-containing protein n=1 Tax=Mucilaginibacter ginsenosidivorans TaxID=398053 RepID=A0A5B8UPV7_9SPHI|nr:hypothetical protein [Mucilaginibacter ginsenosidivorans]QEC61143.1 hypothetical protein FRZ54_00620 [Mucilaginibacter ginsenosidivorans]
MRNRLSRSLLFAVSILAISACRNSSKSPCFDVKRVEKRWTNAYILVQHFDRDNKVTNSYYLHPVGSFTLKNDGTYSVISDDVPLEGMWHLNYQDCTITLDKGNTDSRTFAVEKLSDDSLIISRTDTANRVIYGQHYVKESRDGQ